MKFEPEELAAGASPLIAVSSVDGNHGNHGNHGAVTTTAIKARAGEWRPLFRHECAFGPDAFGHVMENLIQNPNINSSWLFRADILVQNTTTQATPGPPGSAPAPLPAPLPAPSFAGFELTRTIVRRLVPRNTLRDKPLDQTCLIYASASQGQTETQAQSLVVYLPHVSAASEMPFYHPVVRGIAFLHQWDAAQGRGSVSLSYLYFAEGDHERGDSEVTKLTRTALHLLAVVYKHGKGRLAGYEKRVHHDQLISQARVQNTYARLKKKYARELIQSWAESTDPEKHVFEDLCIAAFLLELWDDMHGGGLGPLRFPGFVDIGCGNGLLVHILNREGFQGWGFDARARKSWAAYNAKVKTRDGSEQDTLRELILLPPHVNRDGLAGSALDRVHDGRFPKGTFIISNHADELTPWTPILAALSDCPFLAIPCCSHNLAGERYRAPAPKDKTKADSAYSSLVVWVAGIAADCGWDVEQEMLRIPSTRNTALLGRRRRAAAPPVVGLQAVVDKYGGTAGYLESVMKLMMTSGHEH
ncbi:hypothetical protein C8A05DRAFT_13154 [Staphylotrichum tortipilum]|uniref:tRNA (uracil-O(2)-)-methyltransferase n=1 Tax=Staphylotrichum tortipilum TaxID=2831512 RepID=A0AAN6MQH1_9PEZI|nr:hypothetical protein C8A05DRAFT_13154 [Staphylotrichum longicolle]